MKRLAVLLLVMCAVFSFGCKDKGSGGGSGGSTLAAVFIDATASTQYLSGSRTLLVPKGDTTTISIYELTVRGEDSGGNAVSLVSGYTFLWSLTGNSNLAIDTDPNFNGDDRSVRVKCLGDIEDNGGTVPQATLTVTVTPNGGTGITNAVAQNVTVKGIRSMENPSGSWTFTISGSGPSTKVSTQNGTGGYFEWGSGFVSQSNQVINGNQISWTSAGVNFTGTMAANGLSMSGTHDGGSPQTWSATR